MNDKNFQKDLARMQQHLFGHFPVKVIAALLKALQLHLMMKLTLKILNNRSSLGGIHLRRMWKMARTMFQFLLEISAIYVFDSLDQDYDNQIIEIQMILRYRDGFGLIYCFSQKIATAFSYYQFYENLHHGCVEEFFYSFFSQVV